MASDRSYLRGDYPKPAASALVWMVAALVATFVMQLALRSPWLGSSSALVDQLRLTARGIQQWHLWTLLTHGFLHDTGNPLLVLFSLLSLVLVGRELEPQLGARRFAFLFGGALVTGALFWLILHWRQGGVHFGTGAGILGLIVTLAKLYEKQELKFMPLFVFSVTIRPMYAVYALVALDGVLVVLFEAVGSAVPFGYSPAAHLGGMAAGWVFFRFFHANHGWDRAATLSLPSWLGRRPSTPASADPIDATPASHPPRGAQALRADVDRILDKINSEGFASLTEEEKRTLDDAKDLLSKH